jgi:hypothetical protein
MTCDEWRRKLRDAALDCLRLLSGIRAVDMLFVVNSGGWLVSFSNALAIRRRNRAGEEEVVDG